MACRGLGPLGAVSLRVVLLEWGKEMNGAGGCCVFMKNRPHGLFPHMCPTSPWPPARSLCSLQVRASPGRAPIHAGEVVVNGTCPGELAGGSPRDTQGGTGRHTRTSGAQWYRVLQYGIPRGVVLGGHWPGRADLGQKRRAWGQLAHGGRQRGQARVGYGR